MMSSSGRGRRERQPRLERETPRTLRQLCPDSRYPSRTPPRRAWTTRTCTPPPPPRTPRRGRSRRVPGRTGASEPAPRVDHSRIEYRDFNRDFYVEAPDISSMDADAVDAKRRQLDVHVLGVDPPNPVEGSGNAAVERGDASNLENDSDTRPPTPIQSQAIPRYSRAGTWSGSPRRGAERPPRSCCPRA